LFILFISHLFLIFVTKCTYIRREGGILFPIYLCLLNVQINSVLLSSISANSLLAMNHSHKNKFTKLVLFQKYSICLQNYIFTKNIAEYIQMYMYVHNFFRIYKLLSILKIYNICNINYSNRVAINLSNNFKKSRKKSFIICTQVTLAKCHIVQL